MLTCTKCGSPVAMPADPRALTTSCGKCGSGVDLGAMRTLMDAPVAAAPVDDALAAGRTLSGYRVESVLGRGGMAVVYKAIQLSLNRPVALKTLPRHLAQNPAFVARFNREAGALASLNHPNIINIIDRGSDGDIYYFVMEFVDGTDLQGMIAKQRPSPGEAGRVATQVLAALDYAHKRGVIHRDIKPGNIMIDRNGTVKVTDFGIAHLAGTQDTGMGLTMAGAQMGTANYMAPEQRTDARTVDGRADLYAVGVVLYEMLTGRLPFGAFEPPGVDARIDTIILRALKPDPAARYASAAEMAAALAPFAGATPVVLTPPEPVADAAKPATTYPCPSCKSENRSDAKFCLNCGKTLIETCPKCRKSMRSGAKFCDSCGVNVGDYRTQMQESLKTRVAEAEKLAKQGKLTDALTQLDQILASEGPEEVLERAREQREKIRAHKEKIDAAFAEGQKLYDAKKFEEAVASWKKLPPLPYVTDSLAEAEKKIAARKEAIRNAEALQGRYQFEDAFREWEKAAALSADTTPFQGKMEQARLRAGEAKYAELSQRAATCAAARDYAGAAAAWTEALRWRPGDPAATAELQKMERLKRASERAALVAKGDQAQAAGRPKEAIDHWQKALALGDPDPQLQSKIAAARTQTNDAQKKLLLFGAIGGGALLMLIALIVGIVLIADGCDEKSSSGSSSGSSSSTTAPPASPQECFDRLKRRISAKDLDGIWALTGQAWRQTSDRPATDEFFQNNFRPWRGTIDPDRMVGGEPIIQGQQAVISWSDGAVNAMCIFMKEPDGWKLAGIR